MAPRYGTAAASNAAPDVPAAPSGRCRYGGAIDTSADLEGLLAANRRFYDAFEARDINAMSELWEHSDRAVCTHPGWQTLAGWGEIAGSWFALFTGPQHLQFVLTNERAMVHGDVGWVTVDENLLVADGSHATVAALNGFVRDGADQPWRVVVHHGSPVMPQ